MERIGVSNRGRILILFLFLGCSLPDEIEVWMKTEQEQVSFTLDSISIRSYGQDWYDDWYFLEYEQKELTILPEYKLIATGQKTSVEYHHIFIDALRVNHNDIEIIDVLEPIAFNKPLQRRHTAIFIDSIVLEAPNGTSFFLIDATVQ
jgi:hypothetical protein